VMKARTELVKIKCLRGDGIGFVVFWVSPGGFGTSHFLRVACAV
jgi:hypothetical protein